MAKIKMCPMSFSTDPATSYVRNCTKENCAWWNADFSECLISRIAREITHIASQLNREKIMAKAKHKYRCSICGYLYDRDEIILEHELSPICIGCLDNQELLDVEEMPIDDIRDFREEIERLQKLERRNHEFTQEI